MASFRRKASSPSSSSRSGTKPFLNGQALVSSGLSQLDAALGGGLLLGTLNLLETPPPADGSASLDMAAAASEALAVDLLRYFVAEGVAGGKQRVALVAPDAAAFVSEQMPLELSLAQRQVKQQLAETEKAEPSLTIAWQYGKYGQQQTQSQRRFCHSFDLSRRMHDEMLTANAPVAIDLLPWLSDGGAVIGGVYERLYVAIAELARQQEEQQDEARQVLRLGILGLGSSLLGAPDTAHMMALFAFMRRLRALLRRSKTLVCLALLGSDALRGFPAAFANELRHASDAVLTARAFSGSRDLLPEELHDFHGSLTLRKLPRVHALACHAPSSTRFGLKRERRKLKIEKFHLPPEGSRSSATPNPNRKSKTAHTTSSGEDPLAF
ncbi:hypothetical protein BBJ28_00025566 [Nothophytophthora sp. Chile5]|nr:hypothetical protein BBJ28_00025566 [Nothophytophthora sp. Chile5]